MISLTLDRNKRYGVAVSGGRDSMVLLHLFYKEKYDFFVINIEHGIRGKNSISDSEFVKKYCDEHDIKCLSYTVDALKYSKQKKYTVEEAARELRYEIFEKCLKDICDFIVLGHHLDDQVETVLMRILRGTGVEGICGMMQERSRYLRPLLNTSRKEIDEHVVENNIQYVEDETNQDIKYKRNGIRELVKDINTRYPEFNRGIAKLAKNAFEWKEFVYSKLNKQLIKNNRVYIDLNASNLETKLYFKKAAEYFGVMQDIEERHYDILLDLKYNREVGTTLDMPYDIKVKRGEEHLIVFKEEKYEEIYAGVGEYLEVMVLKSEVFKKNGEYLDADKISSNAVFRHRQKGDKFIKTNGHEEMLADYLTDLKIKREDRDSDIIVLADGGKILAVVGYTVSKEVVVTNNTKNIVRIIKKER